MSQHCTIRQAAVAPFYLPDAGCHSEQTGRVGLQNVYSWDRLLLWRGFDDTPFEDRLAIEQVPDDAVLRLLDYPAFFDLLDRPLPENRDGILDELTSDGLIRRCDAGGWNVTSLGLILFSKRLGV